VVVLLLRDRRESPRDRNLYLAGHQRIDCSTYRRMGMVTGVLEIARLFGYGKLSRRVVARADRLCSVTLRILALFPTPGAFRAGHLVSAPTRWSRACCWSCFCLSAPLVGQIHTYNTWRIAWRDYENQYGPILNRVAVVITK